MLSQRHRYFWSQTLPVVIGTDKLRPLIRSCPVRAMACSAVLANPDNTIAFTQYENAQDMT